MKQGLIAKITTVLQQAPLARNLAQQKFVSQFVLGLIQSRSVQPGEGDSVWGLVWGNALPDNDFLFLLAPPGTGRVRNFS